MGSACYKLKKIIHSRSKEDQEKRQLLLEDSLLQSGIYAPLPEYEEPDDMSKHRELNVSAENLAESMECSRYMDVIEDCQCEFCRSLCPRCSCPLDSCLCHMHYST